MRRRSHSVCLLLICICMTHYAFGDDECNVLVIGARPDHPYGSHMYEFEGQLLARCAGKHPQIRAEFIAEWPPTKAQLSKADSIVFYSSPAGSVLLRDEYRESFGKLMEGKVGFVAIHWGTGVGYDKVSETQAHRDLFKSWLGGWFRRPPCGIKVDEAKVRVVAKRHQIANGWEDFVIRDEFYLNPVLHENTEPLLQVTVDDKEQIVGWTLEREGQGRSVGITLGHFHHNFARDDFRKLLVNAILWSTHVDVPKDGADVAVNAAMLKLSKRETAGSR